MSIEHLIKQWRQFLCEDVNEYKLSRALNPDTIMVVVGEKEGAEFIQKINQTSAETIIIPQNEIANVLVNSPNSRMWRFFCVKHLCPDMADDIAANNLDAEKFDRAHYKCDISLSHTRMLVFDLHHMDVQQASKMSLLQAALDIRMTQHLRVKVILSLEQFEMSGSIFTDYAKIVASRAELLPSPKPTRRRRTRRNETRRAKMTSAKQAEKDITLEDVGTDKQLPRCPKCGEPPRRMVITALVSVDLYNQGVPKLTRGTSCTLIKRIGGAPMLLSCGGGHTWSAENEEAS